MVQPAFGARISTGAPMAPSVAIVGAGNWGTTLGLLQARAGRPVLLCARTPERAAQLTADGENRAWLPGVLFPPLLSVAAGYAEAARADLIVIAVPSEHLRSACAELRPRIRPDHRVVSATKGLEVGSG